MTRKSKHHWGGETPEPKTYFGFIYRGLHIPTGRMYIGKKNYWFSTGRSKSRAHDRLSPKWRDWHWKESDWAFYSSSSKELNQERSRGVEWEFEILEQHTNSRDLHYAEIQWLVDVEALTLVDDKGEYVYLNKAIPGIRFRPPSTQSPESIAKRQAKRDMRLIAERIRKPIDEPCSKCGEVNWRPQIVRGAHTRSCRTCKTAYQREYRARKKLMEVDNVDIG